MCGRFALGVPPYNIIELLNMVDLVEFRPRYNIAPTQPVVAVVREASRAVFRSFRWGLVPHWTVGTWSGPPLINARAESVAEKPAFREAFRKRRCLIPASGFFEWEKRPDGRQPYFFRAENGEPFAFAGLWDRWRDPEERVLESCSIVTTEANDFVRPLHDRMPVILPDNAFEPWLDPDADPATLRRFLARAPFTGMVRYPVGHAVNVTDQEGPELVVPAGDVAVS